MDTSSTAIPLVGNTFSSGGVVTVLQLPAYLPYLELGLNWIALGCHLVTAISMGFLIMVLHWRPHMLRIQRMAPTLLLFLYAHFIYSLLSMPYQVYRVCQWRTPGTYTQNNFSANTLYWLGLPELVYYGSISSSVFLLAIERCVGMKWPLSLVKRHFWLIMATTFGVVVSINIIGHLLELPLDDSDVSICETVSCTTQTFRLYFQLISKIVFSFANVVCSIWILRLLHGIDTAAKMNNRVIVFTIFVELIYGVLPCFTSIFYNQVLNLPIGAPNSGLKGEIAITCCALDGAMCGILYVGILFKRKQQSTIGNGIGGNATSAVAVANLQKIIPEHNLTRNLPSPLPRVC